MATKIGKARVPDVPVNAAGPIVTEWEDAKKRKETNMAVMMGLARKLQQVALDCMRMRADFVRTIGTDGMTVAIWVIKN